MSGTGPSPERVTLEILARRLGVSRASVSNAYNRPDQLSASLRARILEAAHDLGYVGPDPTARALSLRRSGTVGVVFSEALSYAFSDPAIMLTLRGLAEGCQEVGQALVLLPVDPAEPGDTGVVSRAAADGLVLVSLPEEDPLVAAALRRGVPTVTIDQPRIEGVSFVGIDDRAAARLAASHLLGLGHRRVAFVSYRLAPDRRAGLVPPARLRGGRYRLTAERLAGLRAALRQTNLRPSDMLFYECDANSEDAGEAATVALLDQPERPTALLCDSDRLALGALIAARRCGVRVPDELSVVGLDDIPAASSAFPPLTTIRQPLVEKGRAAARLLLDGAEVEATILPTELVVRQTTARSPAP